jgi:hypothetical protein
MKVYKTIALIDLEMGAHVYKALAVGRSPKDCLMML